MAIELLGYSQINEQLALQEAASAGLNSMDHLIRFVSLQQQKKQPVQPDCRELADFTVSNFKKVISILNRTGHARFRRSPVQLSDSCTALSLSTSIPVKETPPQPTPPTPAVELVEHSQFPALKFDFTKSKVAKDTLSLSTNSSSFMSSITGDCEGSVSNGKQFSSVSLPPRPPVSSGKPPLAGKRCRDHDLSDEMSGRISGSGNCHCKKRLVFSLCTHPAHFSISAYLKKYSDLPLTKKSVVTLTFRKACLALASVFFDVTSGIC